MSERASDALGGEALGKRSRCGGRASHGAQSAFSAGLLCGGWSGVAQRSQ